MDKIIGIEKDTIHIGHDDGSVTSHPREAFIGKKPRVGMNVKFYRDQDGKELLFPTLIDNTLTELISFFIRTRILFLTLDEQKNERVESICKKGCLFIAISFSLFIILTSSLYYFSTKKFYAEHAPHLTITQEK